MKLSRLSTVSLLLVLVSGMTGCGLVNRVRAKNSLNEGVRAYRDGNFALAEEKFRNSYELDPEQKNAPLFIARAVQQQYKPGVPTPENVAIGEKAIAAYQDILRQDPSNEDAYKAVVFLYGQMKNDEKVHEMLIQRANLTSAPPERRAEAYTVLASKQWQCAYDITEQKENKTTENRPDRVLVHYKKPANPADFDKARGCVTEGLRLANEAVGLNANSAGAWSYKANLLREASKLAEMEGNQQAKADYDKQHEEALQRQTVLAEAERKKREAEEAAKSPTPPPS
jgi:hypothetical protein